MELDKINTYTTLNHLIYLCIDKMSFKALYRISMYYTIIVNNHDVINGTNKHLQQIGD